MTAAQRAVSDAQAARLRAISLAQAAERAASGVDEGPDFGAWELAS